MPSTQIAGRVQAAGSKFALACDMRFAAREMAIFIPPEPAFGQVPGGGGAQRLARLMGPARALEGDAARAMRPSPCLAGRKLCLEDGDLEPCDPWPCPELWWSARA